MLSIIISNIFHKFLQLCLPFHPAYAGHILDDQDLVDTLDKSKKMSGEIESRVGQSEDTQKNIELARKKYLPVSIANSVNI